MQWAKDQFLNAEVIL